MFAVDPARCARRQADDHRPRLRQSYSEEEIFTDEEIANRSRPTCCASSSAAQRGAGTRRRRSSPQPPPRQAPRTAGRHTEECEQSSAGPPAKLFGSLVQLIPRISSGLGWGIAYDARPDGPDDEPVDEVRPKSGGEADHAVRAEQVAALDRTASCWQPLPESPLAASSRQVIKLSINHPGSARSQVPDHARITVQLLAHGIWDLDDDSWRDTLARLTAHLSTNEHDEDVPSEARQQAAALTAVGMGLLRSGASLAGGGARGPAGRADMGMREIPRCQRRPEQDSLTCSSHRFTLARWFSTVPNWKTRSCWRWTTIRPLWSRPSSPGAAGKSNATGRCTG